MKIDKDEYRKCFTSFGIPAVDCDQCWDIFSSTTRVSDKVKARYFLFVRGGKNLWCGLGVPEGGPEFFAWVQGRAEFFQFFTLGEGGTKIFSHVLRGAEKIDDRRSQTDTPLSLKIYSALKLNV